MLQDQLEKGRLNDVFVVFDYQIDNGSKSLQGFRQQFINEEGQQALENLGYRNLMQIYINENEKKGMKSKELKSKENLQDIISKYSKDKQLEQSNLRQLNFIKTLFLNLIVIDRQQNLSLEQITIELQSQQNMTQIKTLVILEEIKEQFSAQNIQIEELLLDLQINYKIDYIISKSGQETITHIMNCINSTIQQKRKPDKIPCMFRPRQEANIMKSEIAGINNQYQQMWLQMLTQIHGVSESKARSIVLKYPSIKQLMMAYEQTSLEDRPFLLSELEVKSGIIQQNGKKLGNKISELIYLLFCTRDCQYKLFD